MKKTLVFLFPIVLTSLIFFSCSNPSTVPSYIGNWSSIADFKGGPRTGSVCFTIGDTAYVGLGYNLTHRNAQNKSEKYLRDFYKYNERTNNWQQIDSFPGAGRYQAVAFTVNNIGYVGTGYEGDNYNYFNDFYAYDPAAVITDQNKSHWKKVASMASHFVGARRGAVAFGIGSNGFVGTGYNEYAQGYLQDFWKFTPNADSGTWTETTGIPYPRAYGASFVIQGKGYLVTGDNNGSYTSTYNADRFFSFDPKTELWHELRRISNFNIDSTFDDNYNMVRSYAVGFASATKGYISTGYSSGNTASTWEYDYVHDLWVQKTNYEGTAREMAVGFSLNNRLFVGTGNNGSTVYSDFLELKPNEEYDSRY